MEKIYDLIERRYEEWKIDEQFDRQPKYLVTREQRVDVIAAAIWYGRKMESNNVFVSNKEIECLLVWSEVLMAPIIISCRRPV